jgi:ADP-heptose:LPS heptosyltransferase
VGEIVSALAAPPSDLLVYEGGLGPFAALIRHCDLYVGYDSAFQHIASALAVPVVDIFVDAPSASFAERWRPRSRAEVRLVKPRAEAMADAVAEVLAACRDVL